MIGRGGRVPSRQNTPIHWACLFSAKMKAYHEAKQATGRSLNRRVASHFPFWQHSQADENHQLVKIPSQA